MPKYILRLDDASDYMDLSKWKRMEHLLDKYGIRPIFGIIPDNHDLSLTLKYEQNPAFWELMHSWVDKGWIPAMHGYEHRYTTKEGGINPVNRQSEFAGLTYREQAEKIKRGWEILSKHGIRPEIFFAPSHTFDENTLEAVKNESTIRIISDTPAWDVYKRGDFWFIPQQSGNVRTLPFRTVTFCYHPNMMDGKAFNILENFIRKKADNFKSFEAIDTKKSRNYGFIDWLVCKAYFIRRR